MMFEELMKRTLSLDTPRPPSAARQAAEALFSAPSQNAPEMSQVPDVFQGGPPMAADIEASPEKNRQPESSAEPEVRASRVFRVEPASPVVDVEAAAMPVVPSVPEPAPREPLVENTRQAPAARQLPRKKARQRHGEVTIIRPAEVELTRDQEQQLPAETESQPVPRITPEAVPASSPARRRRPARAVEPIDDGWPHLPKLLIRIRALEAEAEALKKHEAAKAVGADAQLSHSADV